MTIIKNIKTFHRVVFSIIIFFLFLLGPTDFVFGDHSEKPEDRLLYNAIKIKHQAYKLKGDNQKTKFMAAIELFQEVCTNAGNDSLDCAKAKLHIASLYDILGNQNKAIEIYDYILAEYPKHRKVLALAKKLKGLIYLEQEKLIEAQNEFKSIVADFSDQETIANYAKSKNEIIYAALVKKQEKGYIDPEVDAVVLLAESAKIRDMANIMGEDIYFGFDDYSLSKDAQSSLGKAVIWMLENPDAIITIEGHTDEFGTNEYNYSLGVKRAESVKKFFIYYGIDENRIKTISCGDQNPVYTAPAKVAYKKSRRAHLIIE